MITKGSVAQAVTTSFPMSMHSTRTQVRNLDCRVCVLLLFASLFVGRASGQVFLVSQYTGADVSVRINECLAAVVKAGGGTCDARSAGGTQMKLSQEINVGTPQGAPSVALILPEQGVYTWALTDGSSCGVKVLPGGSVRTDNPTTGGFYLENNSSTNMNGLLCVDDSSLQTSGGGYNRIDGIQVYVPAGSTFAKAHFWIYFAADNSTFSNITVASYVPGTPMYMWKLHVAAPKNDLPTQSKLNCGRNLRDALWP